jgi:hypothetical protein
LRTRPEGIISTEKVMEIFKKSGLIFNAGQTNEILEFMDRISRLVVDEYIECGDEFLYDKPDPDTAEER